MGERLVTVEAEGETLGEAKWTATKSMGRSYPGIDGSDLEFEVLREPDDDGTKALVRATLDVANWRHRDTQASLGDQLPDRLRGVAERILAALGLRASLSIQESEDEIRVEINGSDLGLAIGKHGRTIEAIQHLLIQIAFKDRQGGPRLVVDAAGYRQRRQQVVERQAERGAVEALRFQREVELTPMSASERRLVHMYLADRGDVSTHSEGDGRERRVVIGPA